MEVGLFNVNKFENVKKYLLTIHIICKSRYMLGLFEQNKCLFDIRFVKILMTISQLLG